MIGIYFSGTGNSKYILECFCDEYDPETKVYSIEDEGAAEAVKRAKLIAFSYPVQYSTVPKIVRDYIHEHKEIWEGKYVFAIATQGLFSGDGAGLLARELEACGARVIGGLHAKMPDSIGDVSLLKHPLEKNKNTVRKSGEKARKAARWLKERKARREGIGFFPRMAGLFGQRLYFGHKTKEYSKDLKIDPEKCVGCGVCEHLCPMKNISVEDGKAVQHDKCAMCYRCINRCPQKAITLLGKEVVDQSVIEKYL